MGVNLHYKNSTIQTKGQADAARLIKEAKQKQKEKEIYIDIVKTMY